MSARRPRARRVCALAIALVAVAVPTFADTDASPRERAVERIVLMWDRAWLAGNGEGYCSRLTRHGRYLVERYLVEGGGRCERIFDESERRLARTRGVVRRVGVGDDFAIVLNELACPGSCTDIEMVLALKRIRGRWLIEYPLPGYPPFGSLPTGGADEAAATEVAVRYVRAERELDGETACSLLTRRSRSQVDRNFDRGCVWLYEHSSVEHARVRRVHQVGDVALANVKPTNDNFTHEILMLVDTALGWRIERINPGLP